MSDNPTMDFFLEQLNSKDWLGISNLYFDNSYMINVYLTRGYVAYSPSKRIFFATACLDSTDTKIVEDTYVTLEREYIGMQQNLTCIGDDMLQHFDLALYSHYRFYNDAQDEMPAPTIPSRSTIKSLTADEETGLYPGCDETSFLDGRIESAIGMYDKKYPYSGAVVKTWKRFYKNQEKFRAFLSTTCGVSDAI